MGSDSARPRSSALHRRPTPGGSGHPFRGGLAWWLIRSCRLARFTSPTGSIRVSARKPFTRRLRIGYATPVDTPTDFTIPRDATPQKGPLAVWISQLRGVYGVDYPLIMAGTLVAIAPVLVLFLMLQKEFIAGLTAGAVKG